MLKETARPIQQDPYRTLGVARTASSAEIKRAYHILARRYHPDRVLHQPPSIQDQASEQFSKLSQAYDLLSDPKQRERYDHILKYGGFDTTATASTTSPSREVGVGYTCFDPCAIFYTQGRIQAKRTTVGIHVPSRIQNVAGLRWAVSSGQYVTTPSGATRCTSQTVSYANGQRKQSSQTVTYFPDGRKEVVVQDGDQQPAYRYCSRYSKPVLPWYMTAWRQMRDNLSLCNCAAY